MDIPEWPFRPVILPVLLYRRLRYGYAFRRIRLGGGKFAIVDLDDYERLSGYNWCAVSAKRTSYAICSKKINGKWKVVQMHREIIEVGPDLCVDHINHNGLDNRKANLRAATRPQNAWNSLRKTGKNRFRGVVWHKGKNKWQVQILYKCKKIHLGYFDDEVEAAKAYDEAAKKLRGEFAVLNFGEGK